MRRPGRFRYSQFEQVILDFLPESKEIFLGALKRLGASKLTRTVLVGRFEDFDAFFDATMKTKKQAGIHNAAMALRVMAEFAVQRLAQLEIESEGA